MKARGGDDVDVNFPTSFQTPKPVFQGVCILSSPFFFHDSSSLYFRWCRSRSSLLSSRWWCLLRKARWQHLSINRLYNFAVLPVQYNNHLAWEMSKIELYNDSWGTSLPFTIRQKCVFHPYWHLFYSLQVGSTMKVIVCFLGSKLCGSKFDLDTIWEVVRDE